MAQPSPWIQPPPVPKAPAKTETGWGAYEEGAGTAADEKWITSGGIPMRWNPQYNIFEPVPMGYAPSRYQELLQRFSGFAGGLPLLGTGFQNMLGDIGGAFASAYPSLFPGAPTFNYPGLAGGGGGYAPQALRYDPFEQELSAAQFQEMMRQFQVGQQQFNIQQELERARLGLSRGQLGVQQGQLGLQRGQFLQQALATPANVFSSFFLSRGQVPPYNAQLANILNLQGQGQPFFGALNPTPAETAGMPAIPPFTPLPVPYVPPMPGVPTPQPPQAIPYAKGGTYMPAEPAVAIGLHSGQPLFTFNEQAPGKTEKVKISPQKKVPRLQGGGTVYTTPPPGEGGYSPQSGWDWNPYGGGWRNRRAPVTTRTPPPGQGGYNPRSGWEAGPEAWINRGLGYTPSTQPAYNPLMDYRPSINPAFSAYPAPLADAFSRDFPQLPFLMNLGVGQGLALPQMGKALHGFPLPSPQALNRMTPSEGAALMDMFNSAFGVPAEDVLWAALRPFEGLRGGMPAMRRQD